VLHATSTRRPDAELRRIDTAASTKAETTFPATRHAAIRKTVPTCHKHTTFVAQRETAA